MPEQTKILLRKLNLAKIHENQAVQVVIAVDAKTGKYLGMKMMPLKVQKFKLEW